MVAIARTNPKVLFASCFLVLGLASPLTAAVPAEPFHEHWRFLRDDPPGAERPDFDDRTWESVTLPHTPRIEALVCGRLDPQWQGLCWYRKSFFVPAPASNRIAILRFEGAMNVAEIWINGRFAGRFLGGYLPYVLDATPYLRPGATNLVAVRLDNRDNPLTGPKPLRDLDFNLYGGLYRTASLTYKDRLHITDPLLVDHPAGGGVFVTCPLVTRTAAVVRVQTHVQNKGPQTRTFTLRTTLRNPAGQRVARSETPLSLAPGADCTEVHELHVPNPALWSPGSPHLYRVDSEIREGDGLVDALTTRIGIRHLRITPEGFWLNGEKLFLRGVNRHQEYPWIGYALSDAAQSRDARKIKEAGFDYVRLSHYPQAPAFLDACDELGLLVMNCLMGWQYFNPDPAFAELKLREIRQLIRRDRNHPSVFLWEVSLNESDQPESFIRRAHAIAHEEYPGDQMYTAGWQPGYDVFLQARQHGGCRGITNQPCVISEYGDWEYYAQNAGFQQHLWKDLQPAERNSRQRRGDGETRLLQQALNFQEAHNDNRQTTAFADGLWVMFDYNRGYAPDLEASGCMDIFRLPKFGTWFYRSQRHPDELVRGRPVGPVLFIATYYQPDSPRSVRVFSNCEEVELFQNGLSLGRRRPERDRVGSHLPHPPFPFELLRFVPGTLRAVGYRNGRPVATHEVRTPEAPDRLTLTFDLAGVPFAREGRDMVFVHAELRDAHGTLVPTNGHPVAFGALGPVTLLGEGNLPTEAGIASRLLTTDRPRPPAVVLALTVVKEGDSLKVLTAAGSPNGTPLPRSVVRYTLDGSTPGHDSPRYRGPLRAVHPDRLRLSLFVGGHRVVDFPPSPGRVTSGVESGSLRATAR